MSDSIQQQTESSSTLNTPSIPVEPEGGYPLGVPAGVYSVTVVDVKHWQHKTGKYDIVKIDLEIQDGPEKGHLLYKYFNQSTKDAVRFFQREMGLLGLSVKSRSEIGAACVELLGMPATATIMCAANGNQVVFLKKKAEEKKVQEVDPDALWS